MNRCLALSSRTGVDLATSRCALRVHLRRVRRENLPLSRALNVLRLARVVVTAEYGA